MEKQELQALAILGAAATGEEVVDIFTCRHRRYMPASPVTDLTGWQIRRVTAGLTADDPAEVCEDKVWWAFRTRGVNPIRLEDWLKRQGLTLAIAVSPYLVMVAPVAP